MNDDNDGVGHCDNRRGETLQSLLDIITQEAKVNFTNKKVTEASPTLEIPIRSDTRLALWKKAAEPAIQSKLAPFTTPGYLDSTAKLQAEKKPHSHSIMKTWGALEPTMAGLKKLAEIGYSPKDKARPDGGFD